MSTPAGWYEDGVTAGQERFWDGTQWTEQFRPLGAAAAPPPAAPAAPVAPVAPVAQPAPAYQPYAPQQQAYVPQQGAAPAGKKSKTGLIVGIIAGVVVLAVALTLILGFTVGGWGGGGGGGSNSVSSPQGQAFLSTVKTSPLYNPSYTDQQLLEAGNALCQLGRDVDLNNPVDALIKVGQFIAGAAGDAGLYAAAASGVVQLCPEVADIASYF